MEGLFERRLLPLRDRTSVFSQIESRILLRFQKLFPAEFLGLKPVFYHFLYYTNSSPLKNEKACFELSFARVDIDSSVNRVLSIKLLGFETFWREIFGLEYLTSFYVH